MAALSALLEDETEKKTWRLYMAQIGEGLAHGMGYEVVPYAKVIGIGPAEDTRTGEQIADDVIAGLMAAAGKEG